MHIKIVDNKLQIDIDSVQTLNKARDVCKALLQTDGIGLIGISAGQAWMALDEICQALKTSIESHQVKS